MLTAQGDPEDRIAGLERGADDYLPKPFEPRELAAARRRAAAPRHAARAFRASRSAHGRCGVRSRTRRAAAQGQARASDESSEAALLQLFAANAGRAFSRSDLCTRLGVSLERSIDVQVTRLRRKIEEDPKLPLYLQTVRGVGYVLVPDRVT